MATNTETQQSKKLKIKSKKISVKTYCDNNEIPYILFNMIELLGELHNF